MLRICFLFVIIVQYAQLTAQQVFNSGGNAFNSASYTSIVSIGEPVAETFIGNSNRLTQGFVQPEGVGLSHVLNIGDQHLDLVVFPNPFAEYLFLHLSEPAAFDFKIYLNGIDGRLWLTDELQKGATDLICKLMNLPAAPYYLKILDDSGTEIKIIAVVKQ